MFENVYAHIDQKNIKRKQNLLDHLIKTANKSKKLASNVGLENTAYLIGIFHDIGKIRKEFQEKIKKNSNKHVDHSSLGGSLIKYIVKDIKENEKDHKEFCNLLIDDICFEEYSDFCNILVYSILSHHGQYDMVRKNKDKLYVFTSIDRIINIENNLNFDIKDFYENLKEFLLRKDIDIIKIFKKAFNEYEKIINRIALISKDYGDEEYIAIEKQFYNALFTRLLVSILKSADINDTINSYEEVIKDYDKEKLLDLKDEFVEKVRLKYESFKKPTSKINKVRNDIADKVIKNAKNFDNGIYRLDLPTGSGKTLLSLAYGVNQLKYKKKNRFFYISSYLSVLEQNAKVIKNTLGNEEYILEHHSNVIYDEDENVFGDDFDDSLEKVKSTYLLDDWTSPIVLTTMVQFFNTLFKGSSSNLRRFKSLANSTIVLDELQSLPVDVLYIANIAFNFLKEVMKVNIVLSTATQPTYAYENLVFRLNYGDLSENNKDIIKLSKEEKDIFKRTRLYIYKDGKESDIEDIKEIVLKNINKSNLVILNTKKAVKEAYNILKEIVSLKNLYYLTTNLHSVDRLKILTEIRDRIEKKEKIVVVSSQLIEAGVDVDFEVVVRSYAGLDSIIQSMGRCNREAKKEYGEVYLINLSKEAENLSQIRSLRERKEAGKYALSKLKKDQEIQDIIPLYFNKLYSNLAFNRLSYTVGDDTLLELLSSNPNMYFNLDNSLDKIYSTNKEYMINLDILNTWMFQSFKRAYDNFHLIEDNMATAIVEEEHTIELINKIRDLELLFKETYDFSLLKNIKSIVRKLNPYSVNIGKSNLDMCEKILDGKIYVLKEEFYDKKIGVNFEDTDLFII